ncbi:MAG: nucleotide pyrophosphohydrolase [Thermoactinospora sp.]|nr:nucleotide pyrophosphohydrolase [Thermoactinospora sp.]
MSVNELTSRIRAFADARDWGVYHTPKNLAMALAGEVGELLAEVQWLTPEEADAVMEDQEAADRIRGELADVTIYLVRLADVLGVDLVETSHAKLDQNELRFPRSVR